MPRSDPQPSKFARYRANKRAGGKKLLRMWVRDPNTPEFQEQAAREAALLRGAPEEQEALDWIEAATADLDLPPYEWPDESGSDKNSTK
jgi:Protein  of unknown function (DUF3018)